MITCRFCSGDTYELHTTYPRAFPVVVWRCTYCLAPSALPIPIRRRAFAWTVATRAGDPPTWASSWETSVAIYERTYLEARVCA